MAFIELSKTYSNWGSDNVVIWKLQGEASYSAPTPWTKATMGVVNAPKFVLSSIWVPSSVGLILVAWYDATNQGVHFYVMGSSTPSSPASVGGSGTTGQEVAAGANLSAYQGFLIVDAS